MFWGCALSGPSSQKRQFLDTPPKKRKFWLITEKLFFGIFVFFSFFFLFFLFFCFFCFLFFCLFGFFFGGFKGQMRWPEGPPHLALNPPYLLFVFCCCFFCFVCLFGGFKGQVRWPKGPPHLALNPPYFFFVPLLSLLLIEKPCFPPKRAFFVYFLCFSFFLPQPFLTCSFSVSLSLSLSCSCLLSSFLYCFFVFFCFLFLSLFHFSFFFAFVFWKNNMKMFNCNLLVINLFSLFYGFLSCLSFQIPFPYLCFSWF